MLLRLQDKKAEDGEYCLADIKEATAAAAPRAPGCKMPANNAKRVVQGAVSLSPALGERMLAAQLLKRSVFVRELMPQDMKVEIDQLTREEAVTASAFLAGVVGRAHARQMDLRVLARAQETPLEAAGGSVVAVVQRRRTRCRP